MYNNHAYNPGQFHIREIKIENYEVEYIYSRVWFSGSHQFTGFRTVSYIIFLTLNHYFPTLPLMLLLLPQYNLNKYHSS